jgi:purine-binding chemotaxis protein CheW
MDMTTETVERAGPGAVRVCLFGLGGERFAVDIRRARELVIVDELTAVPRAPAYLNGVANLRGRILPILDVRPLLGLAARPVGRGSRVLVVDPGSGQVGLTIDAILGLESFDEVAPLDEAARRSRGEFGAGTVKHQDGLVTLLDLGGLLDALKRSGEGG